MSEEIIEKAKEMGWVPQEDFKGDPEKWRPAEEFVERGETILPIVKDQVKRLKEELTVTIQAQKGEIARIKKEAYEKARADIEAEMSKLDEKALAAVQENDMDAYNKVKQERKVIETKAASLTPPPAVNPVFEEWHTKNKWYTTDPELTDYAEFVGAKLSPQSLPPGEFYQTIEKRVREAFPQKFTNPNRDKADMAGSSTHSGSTKSKKSWSDVPKKDQDAFHRAEKRCAPADKKQFKEDWLNVYFSEEA